MCTFCASHVELVLLVLFCVLHPRTTRQGGRCVDQSVKESVILLLDQLVLVEPVYAGHRPQVFGNLSELPRLAALDP